ncbi:MAG: response regulator [Desulfobacteraceae bacterium]|nr:response regulator [Desulfobacteraceae bacterium]
MTLKVLTVDDSKTIRMIVKKAFKDYDCELTEAENGLEGLEVARQEKPGLIVLDITMPVMNGIEMLGQLKADPELKKIPVIMLTAESGKDNVMQIVKMGVTDYIVKPFKGEQLIERAVKIVSLQLLESKTVEDDHAGRYVKKEGDVRHLVFPDKVNRQIALEMDGFIPKTIEEMTKNNQKKIIVDLRKTVEINVSMIKLIILLIARFSKAGVKYKIVGTESVKTELKSFQETCDLKIDGSIEDALAGLQ